MHSFFKCLSKLNLIIFSSVFLLFNIFQFSVFHHFSLLLPNFHVPTCNQLPFICSTNPCVTHLSSAALPVTVAGVASVRHACNYISPACSGSLRTTPDLTLAPPLPGGRLLSCSFPCSAVPVHIVYLLSSNLRQSYHCTYFFKSCAAIHLCTTAAPLCNLVQTSTCAPLLHHYVISCTPPKYGVRKERMWPLRWRINKEYRNKDQKLYS